MGALLNTTSSESRDIENAYTPTKRSIPEKLLVLSLSLMLCRCGNCFHIYRSPSKQMALALAQEGAQRQKKQPNAPGEFASRKGGLDLLETSPSFLLLRNSEVLDILWTPPCGAFPKGLRKLRWQLLFSSSRTGGQKKVVSSCVSIVRWDVSWRDFCHRTQHCRGKSAPFTPILDSRYASVASCAKAHPCRRRLSALCIVAGDDGRLSLRPELHCRIVVVNKSCPKSSSVSDVWTPGLLFAHAAQSDAPTTERCWEQGRRNAGQFV